MIISLYSLLLGYIKNELINPISPPKTNPPSFSTFNNPFQIPIIRDILYIFNYTVIYKFLHYYAIITQNVVKLCSKKIRLYRR